MVDTSHRAFFGDGEHTFRLTATMVLELERKTGGGIGAVFTRLMNRLFNHADILETIRCGLIGGGTNPSDAARLIEIYAADRPFSEVLPLAIGILNAAYFGGTDTETAPDPVAPKSEAA